MLPHAKAHAVTTTCDAAGFNRYDTTMTGSGPPIQYTAGEPEYGVITNDVNAGLRLPQSRPLNLEEFNSGCVNPQGCVDQKGYVCPGPVKTLSPFMSALYDELQSPVAPHSFDETVPPAYVTGIKETGVNSVAGWARDGSQLLWQAQSSNQQTCT
jgi:hypothetical protein